MLNKGITLAALATGLVMAAAPASAETLNVTGTVAPYCNVNLTNVSSGTATIAFLDRQKIANLRVSCNASSGTKLTVNPQNGDLLSSQNNRINYTMELKGTGDGAAFNIAETDTAPGDADNVGSFTRSRSGYSMNIANGVPLEFFMNVNVQNEPQPDFAVANQFPANAAPAGDYKERFDFTVSQV